MAAAESYPEDLKYHPEHDWARIEGDEAVLGHHLVGAGRTRGDRAFRGAGGRRLDRPRTTPYGEVESVKAVSDVIAPLSGEIIEVNEKAVEEPESINDDPTAPAGSCGSGSPTRREVDALLDAEAYRAVVAEQ